MKRYKLFSLGNNQANFITQLYRAIKQTGLPLEITVDRYHELGTNCDFEHQNIIDHFVNIEDFRISKKISFSDLSQLLRKKVWIEYFLISIYSKISFLHYLEKILRDSIIKRFFLKNEKYDIYHIHSCNAYNTRYVHLIPKDAKIICSFWGSDLLMNDGILNYLNLERALKRADVITIQNRELKEMLLVKFGRTLTKKVKLALFPPEQRIYNAIDAQINSKKEISSFKKSHGISNDKIVIVIGHNANPNDQHIEILTALNKLNDHIKKAISIVLPFTYGNSQRKEYIQEINTTFKSSNLELLFIEDFLNWEDLASLRLVTDYLIHMPIFDAMSSVIIETMYGGGHVLAGCWLPYGKYRREGLYFDEIENFKELAPKIEKLISDKTHTKDSDKRTNNQNIIRSTFFDQPTSKQWQDIYTKLLVDNMQH